MANKNRRICRITRGLCRRFTCSCCRCFFSTLVWSIYHVVHAAFRCVHPWRPRGLRAASAFCYARGFALTVQDRLIRLEMRLRLAEIAAGGFAAAHPGIHRGQLVSLRFAGDAELPGAGAQSAGRKNERSQSHQAIDQGLAGGLSQGLVAQALPACFARADAIVSWPQRPLKPRQAEACATWPAYSPRSTSARSPCRSGTLRTREYLFSSSSRIQN